MSRRLIRICQCKPKLLMAQPRDLIFYIPSSDPIKFRQNPLGYLKYLFTPYTSREIQGITATQNVFKIGTGYFAEQSTKPQMLGYSLMDSPVGMFAWICEHGRTLTRGPMMKVRPYAMSHKMATNHTTRSAHMGLNLLVLPRRTCRIRSNLLRAHEIPRGDHVTQVDRQDRHLVLQTH
jgi:hypothetical protein